MNKLGPLVKMTHHTVVPRKEQRIIRLKSFLLPFLGKWSYVELVLLYWKPYYETKLKQGILILQVTLLPQDTPFWSSAFVGRGISSRTCVTTPSRIIFVGVRLCDIAYRHGMYPFILFSAIAYCNLNGPLFFLDDIAFVFMGCGLWI